MNLNLLAYKTSYKDKYLIVSGASHDYKLSVLDSNLKITYENKFSDIDIWDMQFHIDEASSKILISITTTETFNISEKVNYQGFNTIWYSFNELDGQFELKKVDEWKKSNIRTVLSKEVNGKRFWICLRSFNFINEFGNTGETTAIGICQSQDFSLPNFMFSISNQFRHLSQNFDFTIKDDFVIISAIGNTSHDQPIIIKLSLDLKSNEYTELSIPLEKHHNFLDTITKIIENKIYAFFWTTSSEYCKKYFFKYILLMQKLLLDDN